MAQLKKNTAGQKVFFGLIVATTGAALTGATVTVYVCKDGTQSTAAGTVTETAHGGYSFAPTQADTNGTNIGYIYTASTAIPVFQNYLTDVVDANGYASVNLVDILGTAVSTPATAGVLDVNVKNMNNVAATAITTIKAVQGLTTADTIATYTGNTKQTADVATLITTVGTAGVGLTNIGDTRIANLDAAVSTRMATYTQPTGFLAATFPTGTVANTTNITAGTITTATNLTNAATAGDFTAAMKTSLNAATPASVVGAVGSVTGNVGGNVNGNVVGSVGSVTGLTASNVGAIKTVTDKFAFTTVNQVDCNVLGINSVATTPVTTVKAVQGLTTADTIATYTGNTKQTADVAALITTVGTAGVGLTNLGDTRIANLDAAVSTRSTYSGGAVASVTGAVGSVTAPVTVTGTPSVNVAKMNGATVNGTGTSGDLWRGS